MKKLIFMLAAMMLATGMIFIASGCVPRPVEEPVPPEEVAVPEEVPEVPKKIVFYTPAWGIDQAKQIIALFEKENPFCEQTPAFGVT
ncbi:hypothetical protein, partial [Candidatus Hakubella thermalkaliphila]